MGSFEGRQVSHYRVGQRIGAGGMGVVYEAEDLTLGRKVALKFLPPTLEQTPQAAERFKLEARAASALNHPHICTIYEVGEDQGECFIAMELMQGEPLDGLIGRRALTTSEILDIGIGIADGLDAAHAQGIIHRDIKPANIFITARGEPKILDFGLAKASAARFAPAPAAATAAETVAAPHLTSPGTAVGTVAFMSPEQARGNEVDRRSDVFSLGAVLYQMATRRLPFEGDTAAVIFDGILNRDPIPPLERNPAIPSRLQDVINTALEKDRDLRYQSAAEIRAELKRIKRDSATPRAAAPAIDPGGAARRPASSREMAAIQPGSSPAAVPAAAGRGAGIGRLTVAAAILLALAAGGFVAWQRSARRTAPLDLSAMTITRLTQNGKALAVAVAPDGRYVVYVLRDGEMQSLWVRQVATRSDIQVLPPDVVQYQGLSFSRDGDYIYFVRTDRTTFNYAYLYVVPVLGGRPRQLVRDIDAPVTFSPDGKRMAFVRGVPETGNVRLITADADGSNEKVLWEVGAETTARAIVGPDWSPDGRTIAMSWNDRVAIAAGRLTVVNVADGNATTLYRHAGLIGRPRWLPDGSGLLVPLDTLLGDRAQLWVLDYPSGQARRFTNDLLDYSRHHFDRTADGKTIAIVEEVYDQDVELHDPSGKVPPRTLTSGASVRAVRWEGDNAVLYLSGGHIFRVGRNGEGRQQLTPDGTVNIGPSVCGDGSILYQTLNGEESIVNRMAPDASDRRTVPTAHRAGFAICSPEGMWFAYMNLETSPMPIVRAPLEGGAETTLLTNVTGGRQGRVSPDGTMVFSFVWAARPSERSPLQIVPASGGALLHSLVLPAGPGTVNWSPDSKAIHYTRTLGGVANIWSQPLAGGDPRQVTSFTSGGIGDFDWSPDGKQVALVRGTPGTDVILMTDFMRAR